MLQNRKWSFALLFMFFAAQTGFAADNTHAQLFTVSDPPVIQTQSNDVSVARYGYTWIPQSAPRLLADSPMQKGNDTPRIIVPLKKSNEITQNFIGLNTTRMPRSRKADVQPLEAVHLIDGDLQSCWMSRGQRRPDLFPVWIRIDLPVEERIHQIILRKRPVLQSRSPYAWQVTPGGKEVGRGIPDSLKIEVSTDSYEWTPVFTGKCDDSANREFFEFNFDERPVKQIRIETSHLALTEMLYAFSLAEIEVIDAEQHNVALITRGAAISASSTDHSMGLEIEQQTWLWPLAHEIGAKWIRIGYHDDPINWHHVEKQKGILEVDPVTDEAITEMARCGINIIMCLDFGNRLYSGPKRVFPQMWEWYWDQPKPPTTPEALAAWDRYVEFMVLKYKDRVRYFEVWNEWDNNLYWGEQVSLQNYLALARRTIPIIRRCAPDAKILAGSVSGGQFPFGCRSWTKEQWQEKAKQGTALPMFRELAPLVDVIAWHPYYNQEPELFEEYPEDVVAFRSWLKSLGFNGQCMSTEWNLSTFYPPLLPGDRNRFWQGTLHLTEMQKAKHVARFFVQDAGLHLESFFCEIYNPYHLCDLSLLRRTVDSDPVSSLQPQPAFYVVRNLASMMDGWTPVEVPFVLTAENDVKNFRVFTFQTKKGKAVAVWKKGRAQDRGTRVPVSLTLNESFTKAFALDPINGLSQQLHLENRQNQTILSNVLVEEAPLLISFE